MTIAGIAIAVMTIALAVQMTFYGAAACYHANADISIDIATRGLRGPASTLASRLVDLLMLIIGLGLVKTIFFQVYPEFQHIRVGVVYTALPGSSFVTLLFVIERLIYGLPALGSGTDHVDVDVPPAAWV